MIKIWIFRKTRSSLLAAESFLWTKPAELQQLDQDSNKQWMYLLNKSGQGLGGVPLHSQVEFLGTSLNDAAQLVYLVGSGNLVMDALVGDNVRFLSVTQLVVKGR